MCDLFSEAQIAMLHRLFVQTYIVRNAAAAMEQNDAAILR
jgi:hypothetical protein